MRPTISLTTTGKGPLGGQGPAHYRRLQARAASLAPAAGMVQGEQSLHYSGGGSRVRFLALQSQSRQVTLSIDTLTSAATFYSVSECWKRYICMLAYTPFGVVAQPHPVLALASPSGKWTEEICAVGEDLTYRSETERLSQQEGLALVPPEIEPFSSPLNKQAPVPSSSAINRGLP